MWLQGPCINCSLDHSLHLNWPMSLMLWYQWLNCIVGYVARSWASIVLIHTVGLISDSLITSDPHWCSRTRAVPYFGFQAFSFLFKIWCLHCPQCNLATAWHHWRQFIGFTCSFIWNHKRHYTTLFTCAVVLSKMCKHFNVENSWSNPLRWLGMPAGPLISPHFFSGLSCGSIKA